ncbi:hypothetical protein [Wenzhouxiangella marina]|uniref:Uncharacterized protein n=1 Tax=Wenzhouxiangella marina TaxID=1579979 RepID=A0A0K0XS54_9GAMM|nr:hypothetical protein [Wenzhouxiangella marina]AKS40456.1 hypothetical protein WM2015_65 [Wenzhouxiangella marina]MBB6088222.1 hypothetical protein [Wenzhouxiangella marina]
MLRWSGLLFVSMIGWLGAAQAETVTMSFGGLTSGVTVYEENQLRLVSNAAMFVSGTSLPDPPGLLPSSLGMQFTLTALHGGTFDMISIDIRELNESLGPQSLSFIGTREDNSTVQVSINTDGVCCQAGDNFGVETFDLSAMTGLVSLQWFSSLVSYDDIVATLIPPDAVFEDRFEF